MCVCACVFPLSLSLSITRAVRGSLSMCAYLPSVINSTIAEPCVLHGCACVCSLSLSLHHIAVPANCLCVCVFPPSFSPKTRVVSLFSPSPEPCAPCCCVCVCFSSLSLSSLSITRAMHTTLKSSYPGNPNRSSIALFLIYYVFKLAYQRRK